MNTVLIGTQWGDEGKAKMVDYISRDYDIIVRFQGGANAGHTVVVGDDKFVFHLIPSAMMYDDKIGVIGSGVVLELEQLFNEILTLENKGKNIKERLYISSNVHLVLPIHKKIDRLEEGKLSKKIGTTLRGIGPAYTDKISRRGIILNYLFDNEILEHYLKKNIRLNSDLYGFNYEKEYAENYEYLMLYKDKVRNFVVDTTLFFLQDKKRSVLFEGAQGAMLDVGYGTYPFVTSSHTFAANAYLGGDFPFNKIDKSIGIAKAYLTRVGNGPFPTEIFGDIADIITKRGAEFGATTGRQRRVGWLDLPALKYVVKMNGINELALTKLDVLTGIDEIKVAVAYKEGNHKYDLLPQNLPYEKIKPVYKFFHGWKRDINNCKNFDDLPSTAKAFVNFIENELEVKIKYISTGYKRSQLIERN